MNMHDYLRISYAKRKENTSLESSFSQVSLLLLLLLDHSLPSHSVCYICLIMMGRTILARIHKGVPVESTPVSHDTRKFMSYSRYLYGGGAIICHLIGEGTEAWRMTATCPLGTLLACDSPGFKPTLNPEASLLASTTWPLLWVFLLLPLPVSVSRCIDFSVTSATL